MTMRQRSIRPFASLALATAIAALAPLGALAQTDSYSSAAHDFEITTVAEGLEVPWSMTWLPNGDMLVTERPGRLRIVRNGTLLAAPVEGIPEVHAVGQGGLFDVLPHPDF